MPVSRLEYLRHIPDETDMRIVGGHGCEENALESEGRSVLHRAEWVLPMSSAPISNGAVLVRGDSVAAVGNHADVAASCPAHTPTVDHGSSALLPALVNAHTHTELSAMQGMIPFPQESFGGWLKALLPLRGGLSAIRGEDASAEGRRRLTASGVGLYGDISNRHDPAEGLTGSFPEAHVFLEVLGFNLSSLESAIEPHGPDALTRLDRARRKGPGLSLAAHACYSTSAMIIRQSKEWCRDRRAPFSIHAAEHPEEMEFLREGTGFCRRLLEDLGRWVDDWTPPNTTPVQYLKGLGVLDEHTLLVHAVHMTDRDWETVASHGCPVCFCPRSNRNLSSGRANMEAPLRLGITTALGTDSLASNSDLSLFSEASHVLDHYPDIPPEAVLNMITRGGARALHRDNRYGTIEPGKTAALLAVALPHNLNRSQLSEIIIRQGKEGAWQWASSPMND